MPRTGARLAIALLLAAAASPAALACDSTGCLLVTRSASGLLPRKSFRLDLSYRMTDDSQLMSGSDTTARLTRPQDRRRARYRAPRLPPGPGRALPLPAGGCRLRPHGPDDDPRLRAGSDQALLRRRPPAPRRELGDGGAGGGGATPPISTNPLPLK